ncbi:MAG: superoxide dismutase [Pseudomonadales bacterium]
MDFKLTELPYDYDALEPFISQRTMEIHHTKHHAGYVKKLADRLADDPLKEQSLESILRSSSGHQFNLAAQVWNHDFYWQSMTPEPTPLVEQEHLHARVCADFGDTDKLYDSFKQSAANEFGSGWAWLAYNPDNKKLEIFSTTDALNPMTSGRVPLLTLDVWEHAYYLDYQNERGKYIDEFLNRYANWAFAELNLQLHLNATHAPA